MRLRRRDDAISPLIGGLMAVAVVAVMGAVAAQSFMKFSDPLPRASVTGFATTIEKSFTSNLTTSNLVLMPIAGAPLLLREATMTLTIDNVTERIPMSAFADRTKDGAMWRAGEAICVAGTRSDCFRGVGGTVTAVITSDNQLLYQGTHHLQAFRILSTGGVQAVCSGFSAVRIVGVDITYGAGGPAIPVYTYHTMNNGSTVTAQFAGRPVRGGDEVSYAVNAGAIIGLRAGARGFGLNYTYSSWVSDAHVRVLKDGDAVPNVPAFGNQASVDTYLRPYVDVASGRMRLAVNEVILLYEFNPSLTSSAADYQDLVALVQFPGGGCIG